MLNLVGERFGSLLVTSYSHHVGVKKFWACKCDCGNHTSVTTSDLRSGNTKSCGCSRSKFKDIFGNMYGHLEVIAKTSERDKSGRVIWRCLCTNCGNERDFVGSELIRGTYSHCGCLLEYKSRSEKRYNNDKHTQAIKKRYYDYSVRAKRLGRVFDLSESTFATLVTANCVYCGKEPSNLVKFVSKLRGVVGVELNGIDRIDATRGYTDDNVVTCCMNCNRAKNNSTYSTFIQKVLNIHKCKFKEPSTQIEYTDSELNDRVSVVFGTMRKKKSRVVELTRDFVRDIIQKPCHYCGKNDTLGGIDRVDSSVGYVEHNCVPACKHCNMLKGVMTQSEFYNWVGRIVKFAENSIDKLINI